MPTLRSLADNQQRQIASDRFVVARSANADFVLDDPFCAPECHLAIHRVPTGFELVAEHEVSLNGKLVTERVLLNAGDRICVGSTLLVFEEDGSTDDLTRVGQVDGQQVYEATIPVPDGMKVILGREASSQVFRLHHLQVSRRHAEISRTSDKVTIRDLGSSNGTYVNNRRIARPVHLRVGDVASFGPFSFRWSGECLEPAASVVAFDERFPIRAELACHGLTCTSVGAGRRLIEDVSFRIEPGEFACILGPTGAGKSTLLRALSNREHALGRVDSSGQVLLNGDDLYANFERLKQQIAYVPQHEILFDELVLETSLRFTAMLRLPNDVSRAEISGRVDEVLRTVQLSDCRNTRIGNLSGGQRKRASLANEMLAEPGLLFLDEVTSGLDEVTDDEMMSLFRRIADDGRTVICVTHSLACVPRDCDRVICLTRFGRLGFCGTPRDAMKHFRIGQIGEIYHHLSADSPAAADRLAKSFATSEHADEAGLDASASPHRGDSRQQERSTPRRYARKLEFARSLRQFLILQQRYALRLALDVRSNLLRAFQCGIVAILLCSVFGDLQSATERELISCSFILVLSCYWFGCNNSSREIVRERGIFEQERRVVVRVVCYAWSKLTLCTVISAVQAIALVQVVRISCQLPGEPLAWSGIATALALAGVGVGLAVSAASKTEEAAMASVPIVLIPQIILAGAVADLNGINELVARMSITSYWGLDWAKSLLDIPVSSTTANPWSACAIIVAQALLAFAIAVFTLHKRPAAK